MPDTTLIPSAVCRFPEFKAQCAWFRAAVLTLANTLSDYGEGAISDKGLRAECGLEPEQWTQLIEQLLAWGWIERDTTGRLHRSGLLLPPSADALRMRNRRRIASSGKHEAGTEDEQTPNNDRTDSEPTQKGLPALRSSESTQSAERVNTEPQNPQHPHFRNRMPIPPALETNRFRTDAEQGVSLSQNPSESDSESDSESESDQIFKNLILRSDARTREEPAVNRFLTGLGTETPVSGLSARRCDLLPRSAAEKAAPRRRARRRRHPAKGAGMQPAGEPEDASECQGFNRNRR